MVTLYDSHDTSDDPNVGKMRDKGDAFIYIFRNGSLFQGLVLLCREFSTRIFQIDIET